MSKNQMMIDLLRAIELRLWLDGAVSYNVEPGNSPTPSDARRYLGGCYRGDDFNALTYQASTA